MWPRLLRAGVGRGLPLRQTRLPVKAEIAPDRNGPAQIIGGEASARAGDGPRHRNSRVTIQRQAMSTG
jgi:hypothetical protein